MGPYDRSPSPMRFPGAYGRNRAPRPMKVIVLSLFCSAFGFLPDSRRFFLKIISVFLDGLDFRLTESAVAPRDFLVPFGPSSACSRRCLAG